MVAIAIGVAAGVVAKVMLALIAVITGVLVHGRITFALLRPPNGSARG
jgi:hypothetical protein